MGALYCQQTSAVSQLFSCGILPPECFFETLKARRYDHTCFLENTALGDSAHTIGHAHLTQPHRSSREECVRACAFSVALGQLRSLLTVIWCSVACKLLEVILDFGFSCQDLHGEQVLLVEEEDDRNCP